MSRPLSPAAKQAIFSRQTGEVFVALLTISNPNFVDDIRLSNDPTQLLPEAGVPGTVSRGKEYLYMPFVPELPKQDDSGVARVRITIDNTDRRMVQAIRTATSALRVTLEIVLASSPDIVEVSTAEFQLESVIYDALTISGELTIEYFEAEPCSKLRFTPSDFPGLF